MGLNPKDAIDAALDAARDIATNAVDNAAEIAHHATEALKGADIAESTSGIVSAATDIATTAVQKGKAVLSGE